ncbi:hypothetical protein [Streptomyces sp. NPDC055506]
MDQHRRRPQRRPHPRPALATAHAPAAPTGGSLMPAPPGRAISGPATTHSATTRRAASPSRATTTSRGSAHTA